MNQTAFAKYGGLDAFVTIVTRFYQRVRANEQLAVHFKQVSIDRLVDHQARFLSEVLGSDNLYEGRDIQLAHRGPGITDSDFDEMMQLLTETLVEAQLDSTDRDKLTALVSSYRDQVVS